MDKYQEITKELYSKNLDLLNANKTLTLIQKLYEIMVVSYSLEGLSQRFIDVICETLGFSDGVVVARSKQNEHLRVVGITQTQINNTLLELANVATIDLKFDLKSTDNAMVSVFQTGINKIVHGISEVWTPHIKRDDLAGINTVIGQQTILVYPITFGDKILGSFALFLGSGVKELTEFEKIALDRLVTVFGIAFDRIKINIDLRESEKRELDKTRELLKIKDEFVFIATHDLRTPVTAISGFVQLLEKSQEITSTSAKESMEAIKESANRLSQLTTDLLEVARSDSGTIVVAVDKVDLVNVIEKSILEISPLAVEKEIDIRSNLDKTNRFVLADKPKLSEVVENLLSNAIKYNKHSGKVKIVSELIEDKLKVSVSDTGYGIPKDKQERVFQKFFRARQKGTEEVGGTGLGLFVVRMLVEKMKGTIAFSSIEGKGSTFAFTLPVAKI